VADLTCEASYAKRLFSTAPRHAQGRCPPRARSHVYARAGFRDARLTDIPPPERARKRRVLLTPGFVCSGQPGRRCAVSQHGRERP
jgi:hypothetical protein